MSPLVHLPCLQFLNLWTFEHCNSELFWSGSIISNTLERRVWLSLGKHFPFFRNIELFHHEHRALLHGEMFLISPIWLRMSRLVLGPTLNYLMWPVLLASALMGHSQKDNRDFAATLVNWLNPQGCLGKGQNDLHSGEEKCCMRQHIQTEKTDNRIAK